MNIEEKNYYDPIVKTGECTAARTTEA